MFVLSLRYLFIYFPDVADRLAIIREHVRNEMTQFTDVVAGTGEQDI